MGKYLGIDYGDKRVGLALAAPGSIALPYKVLANNNLEQLLAEIRAVIRAESVSLVVVGMPHSLAGVMNQRQAITKQFINFLSSQIDLPIKIVDEQFTSKLYTKQGVKTDIDKHAATAILDTFLAQNNE